MARLRYDVSMRKGHRGNCEYLDGTDHLRLQEGRIHMARSCLADHLINKSVRDRFVGEDFQNRLFK